MEKKDYYYVSCLYGNWSVFKNGIQFKAGFKDEGTAKDWMNENCIGSLYQTTR